MSNLFAKNTAYSVAALIWILVSLSALTEAVTIQPCLFDACTCTLVNNNETLFVDCQNANKVDLKPNKLPTNSWKISVNLNNNQLTSLKSDSQLPSLDTFTATNNQITTFDKESLQGMFRLTELNLSFNRLNNVDDNRMRGLPFVAKVDFSNNYLSKVPNLGKCLWLFSLDLSNQNGQLTSIPDYAFERETYTPAFKLSILLSGNDIVSFGDQAFCSKYYTRSYISTVSLSYKSMKTVPKCVLKQLAAELEEFPTKIEVSAPTVPVADYSDVCNCDLKSFAKLYNLTITGVCQNVFATLNCNLNSFQDPCVNQPQYTCVASLTTTTRPTTITSSTSTTTKKSGGNNSSSKLHLSSFGLVSVVLIISKMFY